jgi:hypothetical protein
MSKNCLGLIGFILLIAMLSATGSTNTPIRTKIISGGEVSITEVRVEGDGQSLTVSGTGFEIFPHRTCGYPEIAFADANGRILLRKDAVYEVSDSYYRSRRVALSEESRFVRFSVTVTISATVALVVVHHYSTAGCEHACSLQYALAWLIDKMTSLCR